MNAVTSDDDAVLPEKKREALRRSAAVSLHSGYDNSSDDEGSTERHKTAHLVEEDSESEAPVPEGDDAQMGDGKSDRPAPADVAKRIAELRPDYDNMSLQQFYEVLLSKTKKELLADRNLLNEFAVQVEEEEPIEGFTDGTGGYPYSSMLNRVLAELHAHNPELGVGGTMRVKLPMPKFEKLGSKRTVLTNFPEMCTAISRSPEDVKDFIEKHLTTQSSIDANGCLILRIQNVKQQQIEGWFHSYIEQYCRCGNCRSIDTDLEKDVSLRLWTVRCRRCRATRNVQTATAATYQATTTKRARLRNRL